MGDPLAEELAAQCRAVGLPEPTREVRFHKTRKWRFDLGWERERLAVEIDGGVWTRGRHTSGAGFTRDCEKLNEAALLGWTVLRFTPAMVRDGLALSVVERAMGRAVSLTP